MNPHIRSVTVEGRDIQRLIYDRLAPAIEGEELASSVLALLTFAVLLMRPSIPMELLQSTVMSTSEHMILAMSDAPEGEAN
jgi:hypothetical protein